MNTGHPFFIAMSTLGLATISGAATWTLLDLVTRGSRHRDRTVDELHMLSRDNKSEISRLDRRVSSLETRSFYPQK